MLTPTITAIRGKDTRSPEGLFLRHHVLEAGDKILLMVGLSVHSSNDEALTENPFRSKKVSSHCLSRAGRQKTWSSQDHGDLRKGKGGGHSHGHEYRVWQDR
jgi:hypothetical protein